MMQKPYSSLDERQKYRRGRKDSESNSGKSSQEKEIEQIIDEVDVLKQKSKPIQRPVESDDETEENKQNRRKLCRRGYWVINKVVQELCEQDKREKVEDQQRQIRYAAQSTQYAAQMMAKPTELAQRQRNIMVRNVQNQLNEIQAQGGQGGQLPNFQEHFPKLQREDRLDNQMTIPDFKPLPQFNFREPPPLRRSSIETVDLDDDVPNLKSRILVPPERNEMTEPINVDLDFAVFEDHGPQEVDPLNLSGQSLAVEQINKRKHNPNQSAFIVTDNEPTGKLAYKLITDAQIRGPKWHKKMDTDELIVINDKHRPIGSKVDLLNRALAGHEVDQRTQFEATQQSMQMTQIPHKQTQDGNKTLNALFEKEIGIEDPEVYNSKEPKPKEPRKERYYYGNPMKERKMLNQLGILKKTTVVGNNSNVVEQIDKTSQEGRTTTVKPTLKLFHREFVSYFELMKTVIEQKVFDNLGEVGRVMELTEQTGLRMIEWTLTRADSSILTYRCKRYPMCHARVNFQMYVGGTDRVKLVSTHLKHCHQPDWTEKSRIDREVWAVLTHPNVQQKIAQTANKKFGDIDLCYYTAEEAAIVENIDFSCVTREQFGKFMEIYHCMNKVGGTAPRRQLRSIQQIQSKGNHQQIFDESSQVSLYSQNVQAGQNLYASAQSLMTTNIQSLPKPIDIDHPQSIVIEDMSNVAPQSNLNSEIPGGRLVQVKNPPILEFSLDLLPEDEQMGDQIEDLELFCQAAADTCPLAPNAKALQIQQQLRTQFGDSIEIFCSNDESMLFFTFSEQVKQASRFMQQPGGSTMLIQSGFKTQMAGMSLMMFACQAQSNMNFILMAGCLIIETLASNNQSRQVDYKWLFQAYDQSKLPKPAVCLTEFNEPFSRAMRRAWPKTQHIWSTYSIIRNGGKILVNQRMQQMEEGSKQVFYLFKTWIKNCTKTQQHFIDAYKDLKTAVKKSKVLKMPIFLLYIKRIKSQSSKWAMYELAKGFDHVTCSMDRRSQSHLFQPSQCLFIGDLLLVQKQKYIFKVVQQVLHKQQGMKLSQVIRAFEYLSCFSYQKHLLPVSKIKDPLNPPVPPALQSEQFVSKACVALVETELGQYFKQKMIDMASKLNSYKVQTTAESNLFYLTQEKGFGSKDEDSVNSVDSDLITNSDATLQIKVFMSELDELLHCECNKVRLLGQPCVHILRVAAYNKQMRNLKRLDCVDNYALQWEDISMYFADHFGKTVDVDILQFDVNSAITLDREKHNLTEVLHESGQLLPAVNREELFEKLTQQIKMQKLMSYKPKVIDLDDSESLDRMRKPYGLSNFVKLSAGIEEACSIEVLLVLLWDLRLKKLMDVTYIRQERMQTVSRALDCLDNKDFAEATETTAKVLGKDLTLNQLLEQVLCFQACRLKTNRSCSEMVDRMNMQIDSLDVPFYDVSINELQRHNFQVSECLEEKLSKCECGSCPKALEIQYAPKFLIFHLEGHRLVFEDISLEQTFTLSARNQHYNYRLSYITLQNAQPVQPGEQKGKMQSSMLIDQPGEGAAFDKVWPGWYFYSASNTRARLYSKEESGRLRNSGFAHALNYSQVDQVICQFSKPQKPDAVLNRHRKMAPYEKRYGVKPQFLVYTLQSVSSVAADECMTVDLDSDNIAADKMQLPVDVDLDLMGL